MKLSTNTKIQRKKDGSRFTDASELFYYLRSAGFEAADVNLTRVVKKNDSRDTILDGNWEKKILAYKSAADNAGVELYQSHLPFHAYRADVEKLPKDEMAEFSEMTLRAIEASKLLGVKWAVAHPRHKETVSESCHASERYLQKFVSHAAKLNIGIAVENVFYMPAEEILAIAQSLGENVGICWDTGHSNLAHVNQYKSILHIAERIRAVHLHDNDSENDSHRPFYMGNIVWNDVMRALREVNFSGTFNLELLYSGVPAVLFQQWNKTAVETARYLMETPI